MNLKKITVQQQHFTAVRFLSLCFASCYCCCCWCCVCCCLWLPTKRLQRSEPGCRNSRFGAVVKRLLCCLLHPNVLSLTEIHRCNSRKWDPRRLWLYGWYCWIARRKCRKCFAFAISILLQGFCVAEILCPDRMCVARTGMKLSNW